MRKINWVSKLTSRKWWTSITSFVTLLIVAFGGTESTATQIAAIIMAGAIVIGYTIGEGLVDSQSANDNTITDVSEVSKLTTEERDK
ncbi:MAG: hypothetical protein SOT58_04615 [Agathobacter sp.]|nr:hypothetical protein [Agathobacter sp.]